MDKAGVAAIEVERFSMLGTTRLHQGQPKKAVEAFRNAFQSSQLLGQHGYMQRACAFNLGAILISTGNYNEGLVYLNQAMPPKGKRDGRSNGDLLFNFGLAYEGLKNLEESINYFEKAVKEYKAEQNLKMEADTYQRLVKLCTSTGNLNEADSYIRQLRAVYAILGKTDTALLQVVVEHAGILLRLGKTEEAEQLADFCLSSTENDTTTGVNGNVLVEVGLIFTQTHNYEKAISCSKMAMAFVQSKKSDKKLDAVLYQNMGAIYNHTGQFEEAITYHSKAADKHALLNNRKSQGHCFLNMGFAYSQLKDMDKAGENFLHSYQAAKDCGDKKTEWQSLEALGAVAYNHGSMTRAQIYYKDALAAFSQSLESDNTNIQERILTKLKQIIEHLIPKAPTAIDQSNLTDPYRETETQYRVNNDILNSTRGKRRVEGRVFAVKRGGKKKFFKVRRSGTLRKFKKVALGLDPNFSDTAESHTTEIFDLMKPEVMDNLPSGDNMSLSDSDVVKGISTRKLENSVLELMEGNRKRFIKLKNSGMLRKFMGKDGTEERIYEVLESEGELDVEDGFTSEEDESKDDNNDDEEATKNERVRPPDSYLAHTSGHMMLKQLLTEIENGDDAEEEADDEEEDYEKSQVRDAMRQISIGDGKRLTPLHVRKEVVADVHAEPASSSESDTEAETSDSDKEKKAKNIGDNVPTSSLPPTDGPLGTYEQEVLQSTLLYESIDHKRSSGQNSQDKRKHVTMGEDIFHRASDVHGHNYFHSDERVDTTEKNGMLSGAGATGEQNGTIYETIRPPMRRSINNTDGQNAGENEKTGGPDTEEESEILSVAKRDLILYRHFKNDLAETEMEGTEYQKPEKGKTSKVCTIL